MMIDSIIIYNIYIYSARRKIHIYICTIIYIGIVRTEKYIYIERKIIIQTTTKHTIDLRILNIYIYIYIQKI